MPCVAVSFSQNQPDAGLGRFASQHSLMLWETLTEITTEELNAQLADVL